MCKKNIVYDIITIYTNFGQNSAEFYKKYILSTVLCIFWPEFGSKPRDFALHLLENGKVFLNIVPPLHVHMRLYIRI